MAQDTFTKEELHSIVEREVRLAKIEERQNITRDQIRDISEAQVKGFLDLKTTIEGMAKQLNDYELTAKDKFVTHEDLRTAVKGLKQWILLPIIGGLAVFSAFQYLLVTGTYTDKLISSYVERAKGVERHETTSRPSR